jgi:endonuclease/exonuclease/phosphatase family metal-dependent hydrolase
MERRVQAKDSRVRELTVLSWNVFHGRDAPPNPALHTLRSRVLRRDEHDDTHVQVNRPLRDEFAQLIAGARWDVCLLQEAPPYWDAELARATGAASYVTLTSRNWFAYLRARLGWWNPDLLGSWEGGSNITLVRPPWRIAGAPRSLLLNPLPGRGLRERRRMSFVRIRDADADVGIANLHLTAGTRHAAEREALRAARTAVRWAGEATPLIIGGDFNLRPRTTNVFERLQREVGLAAPTAPTALDHLLARGLEVIRPPAAWPPERREQAVPVGLESRRLRLSDHPPVEATYGVR